MTKSELSERIREARDARGWSQATLAKEAGVSENTVLSAEQGRRKTQPDKVRAILEALGLEAQSDSLVDLDGAPADVRMFVRVAAIRLTAMDEASRLRLMNELYPRFVNEPSVRDTAARIAAEARESVRNRPSLPNADEDPAEGVASRSRRAGGST